MSAASLQDFWSEDTDKSKTPSLVSYLAEKDLLAGSFCSTSSTLSVDVLSRRNQDRIRILKRLSATSSGLHIKTIVSEVLKGQPVGQCERFDGSDADYQFAYDYLTHLSEFVPPDFDRPLISKRKATGGLIFNSTPALIDLISEGISEIQGNDPEHLYDRDFACDMLQHSQSLTEKQKEHLEFSLENYVNRVDDYVLLFDVTAYDTAFHGAETKQMTKPYKTRFNSHGRIAKHYSQFQSALEYHAENSDNAVLVTLTTDPGTTSDPTRPSPRSIYETTDSINDNFHRLRNWLSTESETIKDTRKEGVPQWTPARDSSQYSWLPSGKPTGGAPDGPVSGRPRKSLEYIKVLEFTEAGYPHLHILFFDVPTRDKDGMPWLCDKAELSVKWSDYGQGQIVDTYPLVYRDDLEDLDAEFANDVEDGFVDWYRYGDHDYSDEWIASRLDAHERIEFTNDETTQKESTAGAYLGKYLSATFGSLMETSDSIEVPENTHDDKTATWKLALYWATNRQFWSLSKRTRRTITPNEHCRDCSDTAQTVRWAVCDTVSRLAETEILTDLSQKRFSGLDELSQEANNAAQAVVSTSGVESTMPQPSTFGVSINFLGAYAKWDLPTEQLSTPTLDDTTDQFERSKELPPAPQTDRPPPAADVWSGSD